MIGTTELMIIFAGIMILFGTSKLPEFARSLGSSIGEFQKAKKDMDKEIKDQE